MRARIMQPRTQVIQASIARGTWYSPFAAPIEERMTTLPHARNQSGHYPRTPLLPWRPNAYVYYCVIFLKFLLILIQVHYKSTVIVYSKLLNFSQLYDCTLISIVKVSSLIKWILFLFHRHQYIQWLARDLNPLYLLEQLNIFQ